MATERKILDYDPVSGVREDYVYDHADDKIHLVQSQDQEPLIEAVQKIRNAIGDKHGAWRKPQVTVAKLSAIQVLELMKLGIMTRGYAIKDEAAFQVWLDNHSKMKVTPGRFA